MADTPAHDPLTQPLPSDDKRRELAGQLIKEFSMLEGKRGIWEKHWEEVSQIVLPYYSTSFYSQGNTVPGAKRDQQQFDVTANTALWRFAAAMESMLTPANNKWHKLRHPDPAVMKDRAAQLWFDQVNDYLFHYRYAPRSGFQANQHDGYVSLGAFGTSGMFVDAYRDPVNPEVRGLRYRNIHLGELFFAANHQGQVDKAYRRYKMTWRQIMQKWGVDALPAERRQLAKDKPEDEVMMLHIIKPNAEYDPNRIDVKGMRYVSYYVIKDTQTLMETGGYRCWPLPTARYVTAPGELYGRGPAMNVLAGIKVLNEEKKTLLKQGHRIVDPVLLAPDDGVLDGFSLKPGAVNAGGVTADGRPLVHALPTGNLAIGKELMDDERMAINDAFLVSLFQILVETPAMSATEVLERAREKGALLSPTMGRFQHEALGPLIEREFDILAWSGLIPPPPPSVLEAGAQYIVEYDAPVNRAMRSEEASGVIRSMQIAAELAAQTQDPSVMDFFNLDTIIPEVVQIQGAPYRFMRSPEEVAQIRQARQQQQAAQQLVQALPGVAALTKAANPQGTSQLPGQPSAA
jgi:Bacteriophage head to tail connecting protein